MFRRAFIAEQFALRGLEHTLQYLAALRGFGIGHSNARHIEAALRIPFSIPLAKAQGGLRNESQPAPLEVRPKLKDLSHRAERSAIPFPRDHALVLVLHFRFPDAELAQKHDNRLQE